MKGIKVEWCENWIKARFARLPVKNGGIEAGYFWKLADGLAVDNDGELCRLHSCCSFPGPCHRQAG